MPTSHKPTPYVAVITSLSFRNLPTYSAVPIVFTLPESVDADDELALQAFAEECVCSLLHERMEDFGSIQECCVSAQPILNHLNFTSGF